MTNLEKWRFYLKDFCSPDSFIDWGFYSMIASALQRRVWIGSLRAPLFPNFYTVLCAPPAVGKGLVIGEVNKVLRFHKRTKSNSEEPTAINNKEQSPEQVIQEKLLIPVGAEATSYQALVRELSKYVQIYWYWSEEHKKRLMYPHSSITFCLEELSSLFRKHLEDLVDFTLTTYDCKDYRYDCIGRGTDAIKNPCVNILAGTTPSFVKRIFGDQLITEGFASRTVFVSEEENRFPRFNVMEFNEEQIQAHVDILAHVKKLTTLYGQIKVSDEIKEYTENWWATDHQHSKPNNSPKLIPYYGRKNITLQKLATVLHFSDNLNLELQLHDIKKAILVLADVEKRMHFAVNVSEKNPVAKVTDDIEKFICRNGILVKRRELLIQFWSELPNGKDSLDQILDFLTGADKIKYYREKESYGRREH